MQDRQREIPVKNRKAAAYLCLVPDKDLEPGEYHLSLGAETEEGFWEGGVSVKVCSVRIPEDAFPVTNWFSLEAISRFHHVEMGTPEYLDMLRV